MAPHAMKILNGSEIAKKYLEEASKEILKLNKAAGKKRLTLGTIQIGETKDIALYSNYLSKLFSKLEIGLHPLKFLGSETNGEMLPKISKLIASDSVTAVMVFSPLPKKDIAEFIFLNLPANKDVEGRTFLKSHFGVFSPTALSVLTLLESTGCDFVGKEAVVIGHSDLVGKPTAVLLADKMATVAICHKETRDLKEHVRRADIIVAAAGKPHLVKGEWIKPGAIVIDVGENVVDGKIVGDVEFEAAKDRASFITPVPGGVGPVTNVMLIKNLIRLHEIQEKKNGNC
jgi:methylenetetrahydrofolate dehydrogenase (NADP+) / methenyltetrahydrofolate cyclohydrolase